MGIGVGSADSTGALAATDAAADAATDAAGLAVGDGVWPDPPVVQAAMTGASAAAGPSLAIGLEQLASRDAPLEHVAGQLLLEIDARTVVGKTS